jgi:hypothetical protein
MMLDLTGKDITLCPVYSKGTLAPIAEFPNTRKTDKHRMAFASGCRGGLLKMRLVSWGPVELKRTGAPEGPRINKKTGFN